VTLLILSTACVIGTAILAVWAIWLKRWIVQVWSETLNGMAEEMR
jgi:hypothetical protein